MAVAKQVTVAARNRPGVLRRIAEALAEAKINISGLGASGYERKVRLLVSDAAKAVRALKKAGLRAKAGDVVVVNLADRVGMLGRTARRIARGNININFAYGTVPRGGKSAAIVFEVANPRRAARLAR